VEADADSLDGEVAAGDRVDADRVDRARRTLDCEPRRGVEVDRDAEAARDVVRTAGRDQRELRANARVRRRVGRRVERPIAPEEHHAAFRVGEGIAELLEGRRDTGLDARSREAEQQRRVFDERRLTAQAARVPVRDQQQVRGERPKAPGRSCRGRSRSEGAWCECLSRCHVEQPRTGGLRRTCGGQASHGSADRTGAVLSASYAEPHGRSG
jgi:hypothetical protein